MGVAEEHMGVQEVAAENVEFGKQLFFLHKLLSLFKGGQWNRNRVDRIIFAEFRSTKRN